MPLTTAERAILARDLGRMYRAAERTGVAVRLFRVAKRLDPALDIGTELSTLETQQKLLAENAARAPVINEGLEQPHPVRPQRGGAQ